MDLNSPEKRAYHETLLADTQRLKLLELAMRRSIGASTPERKIACSVHMGKSIRDAIDEHLPASRKGWRYFQCPDCNHRFKEATRDRMSPSGTDCPKCSGWCSPETRCADDSLNVDAMGNLTTPMSERVVSL